MNRLCAWCKQPIDPRRSPSVISTQRLPNGESFERRYHARPCYSSWVEFNRLHEFQPLDPSTHEHGEA